MKKTYATLFTVALAAALGACSDATGSSGDARMQVSATGDQAGPAMQVSPDGRAPQYQATTAEGTVQFRARVYVQTDAGGWVELTNGAAKQATVDASGRAGAVVLATSSVDAGAYSRVRVVFENVRANLNGTLVISTGLLSGTVSVDTQGDGSVTVERQVSAHASAGATTRLLINLNSDIWLNQASASSRTVSEAAFAAAVAVTAS